MVIQDHQAVDPALAIFFAGKFEAFVGSGFGIE
jgi:hypothetical protein